MKISKSLFLAFAGLGLFACSNEDVNEGIVNGDATVTVSVNTNGVISRAAVDPSSPIQGNQGDQLPITIESIKVTLTAGQGSDTQEFESMSELSNGKVTFTGVRNPKKIEVSINGGKAEPWYLSSIYAEGKTGLKSAMYGSAEGNEFKETTVSGKTVYEVTVTPKHETAVLEFSGISHKKDGDDCCFNKINFEGLFLNHVKLQEGKDKFMDATSFKEAMENDMYAPTYSMIPEDKQNFLAADVVWPDAGQVYSYTILPEASINLPVLTLCFKDIETKPNVSWSNKEGKGYAAVKQYRLINANNLTEEQLEEIGAESLLPVDPSNPDDPEHPLPQYRVIKSFTAGYVYKFTGLEVADENIGTTIEGGKDASLIVDVEVHPWVVVEGTVDWN